MSDVRSALAGANLIALAAYPPSSTLRRIQRARLLFVAMVIASKQGVSSAMMGIYVMATVAIGIVAQSQLTIAMAVLRSTSIPASAALGMPLLRSLQIGP
jgi:hypothetical protein